MGEAKTVGVELAGKTIRVRFTGSTVCRFEKLSGKPFFGEKGFQFDSVSDLVDLLTACDEPDTDSPFDVGLIAMRFGGGRRKEIREALPLGERELLNVQLAILEALSAARGNGAPNEAIEEIRKRLQSPPDAAKTEATEGAA